MQAAEKLFTSRQFHEITLDDIVREAHVGKGTIYTYFADKDDLFFQVATSGFDSLCDLLRRLVPGDACFVEQLVQACEAVSTFFNRRRQLFRMIQAEDARMSLCRGITHEQWIQKRQGLVEAMGAILHRGQVQQAVRDDLPPEVLANFLLGMLRTRARDLRDEKSAVTEELLVDLFLKGAARPEPAALPAARRSSAGREAQA
jgi:AcrR family transcriptional regulator